MLSLNIPRSCLPYKTAPYYYYSVTFLLSTIWIILFQTIHTLHSPMTGLTPYRETHRRNAIPSKPLTTYNKNLI
jgi:hypothetical protein